MAENTQSLKPSEFPICAVKRIGDEQFIAVRKTDTEKSDWHVVGFNGFNYGAWQSVENFVEAYKKRGQPDAQGVVAEPLSEVRLSVRHL